MNEYKKTALDAATSESGIENMTEGICPVSEGNCNTGAGNGQGRVSCYLMHGAGNAIRTAELVKMTGFHSARDMQKQIERERAKGFLILSRGGPGGGYFLPAEGEAGQKEIRTFVRTLEARARNTFRTLRAARAALQVIPGQMEVCSNGVEADV